MGGPYFLAIPAADETTIDIEVILQEEGMLLDLTAINGDTVFFTG